MGLKSGCVDASYFIEVGGVFVSRAMVCDCSVANLFEQDVTKQVLFSLDACRYFNAFVIQVC